MAIRARQVTFIAMEEVWEYLEQVDNKTKTINRAVKLLMNNTDNAAMVPELEQRIAILEQATIANSIVTKSTRVTETVRPAPMRAAPKVEKPAKPAGRPTKSEAAKARGYLTNEDGMWKCETEADYEHWWWLFKGDPQMPETIQIQPNEMVDLIKENSGKISTVEELAELWNGYVAKQNELVAKRKAEDMAKNKTVAPVSGKQVEDDGYDWGPPIVE